MNLVIGNRVRCFQSKYRKDLIGQEGVITKLLPSGCGCCDGKSIVDVKLDSGETRKFHTSQLVEVLEFPDVRIVELTLEYSDGAVIETNDFLDIDLNIEEQVFENFDQRDGSKLISFKWQLSEV